MNKENRTHRVKKEIRKFCMIMSAHGVPRVARSEHLVVRLVWCLVVLVCLTSFCYHAYQIIAKFKKSEKIINIAMSMGPVQFPAVTICNINPYKQTAALEIPELKRTMTVFEQTAKEMQQNATIDRGKRAHPTMRYVPGLTGCDCPKRYGECFRREGPPPNGTGLCVCFYDQFSLVPWPCYDKNEWSMRECRACSPRTGTCPYPTARIKEGSIRPCICQNISNYCMTVNTTVLDDSLLELWDLTTTDPLTTSTEVSEFVEALGFQEVSDSGSLMSKGKENLAFVAATLSESVRVNISYQSDDFIKLCSFDGKECNMKRDFSLHVDSTFGNCFTYNRQNVKNTSRSGPSYGLKVTIHLNPSEYMHITEAGGIRVSVHDHEEYPFPDTFGYNAPPGKLTSFGLQVKRIRRLEPPTGECVTDKIGKGAEYLYHNYSYSTEGCYRSCLQNFIISECGCGDPRYPTPEDIPHCPVGDGLKRACVEEALIASKLKVCLCPQPCSQSVYTVSISAAKWPLSIYQLPRECLMEKTDCLEEFRQNGAMIEVYYERTGYELLVESQAFGWPSLMADFGGQLGLWLGASVITLTELLVLIWNVILICCESEDRYAGREFDPVPTEDPNWTAKRHPRRRRQYGQKLSTLERDKDGHWRISIEKKRDKQSSG